MVRDYICKPLTALSVDSDISAETDLLGYTAPDLQSNLVVHEDYLTGNLKYIDGEDWDAGAWLEGEDTGNYLVLHATAGTGATITAELIGGVHGAKTLDSDGLALFRITGREQAVKFTATKDGKSAEKIYHLANIVLETA